MGTSTGNLGQNGNTPLIPSWLNDDQSAQQQGQERQAELQPADPKRFSSARGNFTRYVNSGGSGSGSLRRATSGYTIIDITGDQFIDNPVFLNNKHSVYIGIENEFYRLFEVDDRNIRKCLGISALGSMCQPRLNNLYQKIIKYVEPNIYDI